MYRFALGAFLTCTLFGCVAARAQQDEAVVRTTYAKLAYAVQSRTVYVEAQKHPNLTAVELAKALQENELRFEISELSGGNVSDIGDRPWSDFVTRPDSREVLRITHDEEAFTDETGTLFTSYFAVPSWGEGSSSAEDWDTPVKTAMRIAGGDGQYSRYVAATITARFEGKSRTYRALWMFSDSDLTVIDLVTGNSILRTFATESTYPSVLTDTKLRSRPVVNDWLNSTQRFEASCKKGKFDVCCDAAAIRCGVSADDLRSTKPAPNTTAAHKGGL
jgi:hypothetical protein